MLDRGATIRLVSSLKQEKVMKRTLILTALICYFEGALLAQTTTPPVGFNTVTCLPNSDTYCSVPFAQTWDFQGLISGTPSVVGEQATITPQGTIAWTTDQFAGLYFVRILTGAKAGMYFQILNNATGTLTIDLAGGNLTGVANGDGFAVSKFWTLGTLFPPATQTTIVASTSTLLSGRRTQLLLPDLFGNGINLAPSRIFFIHSGVWKEATTGFPIADNTILSPDAFFIVRHNHATITAATTYTASGIVELNPVSAPLATHATVQQDNPVTTSRPVPVKLQDLKLVNEVAGVYQAGGAFVASASTLLSQRRDQLLVFDNSAPVVNRAPAKIYFYVTSTSNWREATTGFPVADDIEIAPSSAMLIRKYQTGTGATTVWTHTY
jgi:uncharacterized protein (TIGR02597 family)